MDDDHVGVSHRHRDRLAAKDRPVAQRGRQSLVGCSTQMRAEGHGAGSGQ